MRVCGVMQYAARRAVAISVITVLAPSAGAQLRLTPAMSRVSRSRCAELQAMLRARWWKPADRR